MTAFKRIMVGAALMTLGTQVPAAAQDCLKDFKVPAAGGWAEWTTKEGVLRMAMLGNETREGKNLVRMEMSMTGRQGPMIMQVLAPNYPYEMSAVEEIVMKAPGQPAMKMSGQMMRNAAPKDMISEICRGTNVTRVGEESVTVPAGTYRTIHYHDSRSNNDVWVNMSVPFGLVRSKSATSGEIVLSATGTGAKSHITETPQEMPGMPRN